MSKVLVTGSEGFIGRHVVAALEEAGHTVVPFDLKQGQDIRNAQEVRDACAGVDAVVHLAALVSVPLSLEQPEETHAHNVEGFANVLEAARAAKVPGRVVYASSAAVYGEGGTTPLQEEDAAGRALLSPYAESKAENERQAAAAGELETVGLRFFNVYGAGQEATNPYAGVLSHVLAALREERPFTLYGDGLQTRDFVAAGDVAAVITRLLEMPQGTPLPPVMNVASGRTVTLREVMAALQAQCGQPLMVEEKPAREGDIRHSAACINRLREVLPAWRPLELSAGLDVWLGQHARRL